MANGTLDFEPGLTQRYSSTNFVLLGLLLARHYNTTWDALPQLRAALPDSLRVGGLFNHTTFVPTSRPANATAVHGYDRTSYNGQNASLLWTRDVSGTKGVFAGWAASDVASTAADVARYGYEVYGPHHRVLSADSVAIMTNFPRNFYGFATFDLGWQTGLRAGRYF